MPTPSVLQQVLTRLQAILQANVPSGCHVYRDRADPISLDESPAINQRPGEDAVVSFAAELDLHTVQVDLEIVVRQEGGSDGIETIHQAIHKPIVTDAQLAALCESRRLEGGPFEFGESDTTTVRKRARYRFTYSTPSTTL